MVAFFWTAYKGLGYEDQFCCGSVAQADKRLRHWPHAIDLYENTESAHVLIWSNNKYADDTQLHISTPDRHVVASLNRSLGNLKDSLTTHSIFGNTLGHNTTHFTCSLSILEENPSIAIVSIYIYI